MILPLVLGLLERPAHGAIVEKLVDVCLLIDTEFVDLAGDNWSTNTTRKGRGVRAVLNDAWASYVVYLDDETGCVEDIPLQVEENNGTFSLEVESIAIVNGVTIESWRGENIDDGNTSTFSWPSIATGTGLTFSVTKTIPIRQRWMNLAVATMIFRVYHWNVDEPVSRACCTEGSSGYQDDGTCTTSNYTHRPTPIQLQTDDGIYNGDPVDCCASNLHYDGEFTDAPGLRIGLDQPYKFAIAHEIGHVIASMRMGAREQTDQNAPMNECNGDLTGSPPDFVTQGQKGIFTKEFNSTAFREGWADFVAAVTFNTRTESSCELQGFNLMDFDLDGDIDSDRSGTDLDAAWDCEGDPSLPGDPALQSYVTAKNWLYDLEMAVDDDVYGGECVEDADPVHEANRATQFDHTRFLWDLTTDYALTPGTLSDLHVDMCPRGWQESDATSSTDEELPLERLKISAEHNNIEADVNAELDQISH